MNTYSWRSTCMTVTAGMDTAAQNSSGLVMKLMPECELVLPNDVFQANGFTLLAHMAEVIGNHS